MQGTIGFENLRVPCMIGVDPHEQDREQELLIDLHLHTNIEKCVSSDRLDDTISYADLAEICTAVAKKKKYHLMETLAHAIIQQICLDKRTTYIRIRIKKPRAFPQVEHAFVELQWSNR